MILRINVKGKFGHWLYKNLLKSDRSVYEVADSLRMAPKTVYHHLKGTMKPTFSNVIAYCWYFENGDYPEDIWDMVKEGKCE